VLVAYTVVQTLEGFVITPWIVGKTVGLSEIWVLVALFVGGEIFGFLGILLAVPAAAVAKIFVVRAVQHYRQTELFLRASAEPVPDRRPASYEELAEATDVEPDRQLPTPPGSARRKS
jgi:hypothetical protein